MKDNNNISEQNGDCISTDVLLKYIKGDLSGFMKNMVERHIASCEICSDELEGLSLLEKPEKIDEITIDLHHRVDAYVRKSRKEIPHLRFNFQIAATILLLIGISSIFFFIIQKQPKLDYATLAKMELADIAGSDNGLKDTLMLASYDVVKNKKGLVKAEVIETVALLSYSPPVLADSLLTDKEIVEELKDDVVRENITLSNEKSYEKAVAENEVTLAPSSASKKVAAAEGIAYEAKSKRMIKSEGLSYSQRVREAVSLFEKKKYESALDAFESIAYELPLSDSILLYKSICYYHLTQFDDAILNLTELAKNPRKLQFVEARWYYALSLIGAQRRDEAILILEQIVKDDSIYKREAKKELNKLKINR